MMPSGIRVKMARLAAGGQPRVLDLFAGCGGLSLGFHAAGFALRAAVESDPDAAQSHGVNFHPDDPRHAQARDIITTHIVADHSDTGREISHCLRMLFACGATHASYVLLGVASALDRHCRPAAMQGIPHVDSL